jgi:hypothetical protein
MSGDSLFKTHDEQRDLSKQMIEKKKKEVGSWIPGRANLRLNLDALRADRRESQIKATLDSAQNAEDYTTALKDSERKQTEFILRSNTLRLLEQISSTNHTAGAMDRFVKKSVDSVMKNLFNRGSSKNERGYVPPDASDVSVRRDVAEYFKNDPQAAALYGKEGLGSAKIADADKAVLLRNLQELFKAFGRNTNSAESRLAFESTRSQIVHDIAKALPSLSPDLQELAMQSMGELKSFSNYDGDLKSSNPDTFSQAKFLESLTPESFAALDEEAKIQYLGKVKLDAYAGLQLVHLLKKEKNRAVLDAAMKAFGQADSSSGPDGSIDIAVGYASQKWAGVQGNEATKLLNFYNKTTLEEALLLPIDRSSGYNALKALDAYASKAYMEGGLPAAFEKMADTYNEYRQADTIDLSYFAAAPGYYLEKHRSEKTNYEKKKTADDLTSIVRTTWRKIESLVNGNLSSNLDRIDVLVTAMEAGKRVLSEMTPDRSYRQAVGGWQQRDVIRKLDAKGRREKGLASRLEKVFSS